MAQIDHHIASLLEDHDCVIVPHFGGFVANYAPAKINPVNHRFDPPHRKLSFNKFLTHNDGLLAAYVARKEQESYEKGIRIVQDFAIYLKSELKHKKRVKLDRVGVITKNSDGSLRFEQVENANFYSDGTGLESFFARKVDQGEALEVIEKAAKPTPATAAKELPKQEPKIVTLPIEDQDKPVRIPEATPPTKAAPVPQQAQSKQVDPIPLPIQEEVPVENEVESEQKPSRRWVVRTAAAVIAIPLIGYAVWLSAFSPISHGNGNFQFADLNPFAKKGTPSYILRTPSAIGNLPEGTVRFSETETEEFLTMSSTNAPDKTLVVRKLAKPTTVPQVLRYHIIGGCFGLESNANGLAEKYAAQGNHTGIVDQKGTLYRVSVASFATKKEAKQALTSLKSDIPGAWLLYK